MARSILFMEYSSIRFCNGEVYLVYGVLVNTLLDCCILVSFCTVSTGNFLFCSSHSRPERLLVHFYTLNHVHNGKHCGLRVITINFRKLNKVFYDAKATRKTILFFPEIGMVA